MSGLDILLSSCCFHCFGENRKESFVRDVQEIGSKRCKLLSQKNVQLK